jgi:hypothetical protein
LKRSRYPVFSLGPALNFVQVDVEARKCKITVQDVDAKTPVVILEVFFPEEYPNELPQFDVTFPMSETSKISGKEKLQLKMVKIT